jgi:hypothetical protein
MTGPNVTVTELMKSREGSVKSRVLEYYAKGSADELEIREQVAATAPATYGGLFLEDIETEVLECDEDADTGQWYVRVTYGLREVVTEEEPRFTFDTSGATAHVTQSLQTMVSYALPGKTAPNFKGAIGFAGGEIQGTEVTVPNHSWSETHSMIIGDEAAFKVIVAGLTGKVNNAAFKGAGAGECLLLGVSGTKSGYGKWELTFTFANQPSKSGIVIGDIKDVDKEGWDYLWVLYSEAEDETAHALVKTPVAVYVERVYERGDFSLLGIGT